MFDFLNSRAILRVALEAPANQMLCGTLQGYDLLALSFSFQFRSFLFPHLLHFVVGYREPGTQANFIPVHDEVVVCDILAEQCLPRREFKDQNAQAPDVKFFRRPG